MNWIKENGGPLVVGAVVLGMIFGYIELRAPRMVSAEMDTRGLVSDESFANLEDKVDAVAAQIGEQKETHNRDSDRMDSKIERIVDILLEE